MGALFSHPGAGQCPCPPRLSLVVLFHKRRGSVLYSHLSPRCFAPLGGAGGAGAHTHLIREHTAASTRPHLRRAATWASKQGHAVRRVPVATQRLLDRKADSPQLKGKGRGMEHPLGTRHPEEVTVKEPLLLLGAYVPTATPSLRRDKHTVGYRATLLSGPLPMCPRWEA